MTCFDVLIKQGGLPREIFRLEEITKADADQTKPLLRSEGNTLLQRKCDGRQLFARRGRGRRSVAAREDLELRGLQIQYYGSRNPPFVARCGPGQLASLRIIGSVSASGTSCSNVSSAEMDFVGRSSTTADSSTPRANS
jgi:hypothetical protein